MTMEVIQHIELGSAQASISFSSIPATFTDLYVLFSVRQSGSGVNQALLEFNGSSSNFSFRFLQGSGSAASSGANTLNYGGLVQGSASTSNTFSSNALYIPNYASSTAKSWSIDAVTENNATEAYQHLVAGLWNNTAAINSIAIKPFSGNLEAGSSATLYGIKNAAQSASIKATGGQISISGGFVYHTFNASGTFSLNQSLANAEALIVAGGGGGGAVAGGGGGAGGLRQFSGALTAGNYTITVGAGGNGATVTDGNSTTIRGGNGSASSAFSLSSTGGGGGGSRGESSFPGLSGGSGGGGGYGVFGEEGSGGSGTAGQGFAGGTGKPDSNNQQGGGGGGGAGGAGVSRPASGPSSANGGAGFDASTFLNSSNVFLAGGGGGGGQRNSITSLGGSGVGGNGSMDSATAGNGVTNTGSGGGGGKFNANQNPSTNPGGNGASGVVIVRYPA